MPAAPIVIVGAGLAGGTAAATLRKEGYEGGITLIGSEPHPPYERPGLSKAYLRGETGFDDLLVRPVGFWEANDVEVVAGAAASGLDVGRRVLILDDGREVEYDRLLLATGCRNRDPSMIPGADLGGVYSLRTVDDADRLRSAVTPGCRVVIAGMSFIGSEVAASLAALGADVTGVMTGSAPLEHIVGRAIGQALSAAHGSHGVRLIAGERVSAVEGEARVEAVTTSGGTRVPCDVVVLALGVVPNVELATAASIEVEDGIVVDEWCRTSIERVFACGDVARYPQPVLGRRIRVEHWQHARRHGRAAARAMLGGSEPYVDVPWFWSDQYEHEVQWAGFAVEPDQVVEHTAGERRTAFHLQGGSLRAAVTFDDGAQVRAAIPAIGTARAVDPDVLESAGATALR